jgi:hypothetical protein
LESNQTRDGGLGTDRDGEGGEGEGGGEDGEQEAFHGRRKLRVE